VQRRSDDGDPHLGQAYGAAEPGGSSRRTSAAEQPARQQAPHVQQQRWGHDAAVELGSSLDIAEDDIAVEIDDGDLVVAAGEEEEEAAYEDAQQQARRASLDLHDANLSVSDRSGHLDGAGSQMWSADRPDWVEGVDPVDEYQQQ
jgi:hypothetical protein